MKPFKYLPSEVAKINQIFSKNNVKLTFDKFSDYFKSLEELVAEISKCSIRHHLENYYFSVSREYDIKKLKCLTETKYYLYSTVIFQTTDKINMHLNALRESFYYFPSGLFDIDSAYGIASKVEYQAVEGFYYKLTNGNLPALTDEFFEYMMEFFQIQDNNLIGLKRLRQTPELLELNYISIDYSDNISKLGFATPLSNFVKANFSEIFDGYVRLKEFCKSLEKLDQEIGVGLQFSVDNPSFLSLEIKISKENLDNYLNIFEDNGMFTADEKRYIYNIIDSDKASEYTIKFRWSDKNKYTVKWYNEFPNETNAPEWYEHLSN